MSTVILVLHLMIAAALIGVVLLQRSEGGALGMGGGGGAGGGFLTGRGTANLLTRTTAALAGAFFVTSLVLTLLARQSAPTSSVFDAPAAQSSGEAGKPAEGTPAPAEGQSPPAGRGGILDKLQPPTPTPPSNP